MFPKVVSGALPRNHSGRFETLLEALAAHAVGQTYMARCPAHDDRNPSLSIALSATGKLLVRCHAGCDQIQVIGQLRAMGLWADSRSLPVQARSRRSRGIKPTAHTDHRALRIWGASQPAAGTIVESYLSSRRLRLPEGDVLRFHPSLRHPTGGRWPAMVALVSRGTDGTPCAIHRTFLAADGNGKAPVEPTKMMLGPCGGGVVRLAHSAERLMVGEGIETCLAAMQATGRPAWAALSTSGLRSLEVPTHVTDLIVLADGDLPGELAARACAEHSRRVGLRIRIARPTFGSDFADMLLGEVAR